MGCKMIAAITWTQLELKGLLEDEESHVYFERAKRHLGLHPFHLTDLNAALREILNSTVNSYDQKLQGIILSYKNPKLLSRMGAVLYDTCFIHIDIEADFYIFRPNVGNTLKGIVNKKSQDHVGILVHKTFNATIPRPDDDENWPGHLIHIGQEVRFKITCLDFKDRLPYIRGYLDEQDYLKGCQAFDETFGGNQIVDSKSKKCKFSYNEDGDLEESNMEEEMSVDNVDHSIENDDELEEKVLQKKSKKKIIVENIEDGGIRARNKKKPEVEVEGIVSESDESDSHENNQSHVGNDGNIEEEFLPGKLKLKRENLDDKINTKKKKKKTKVKTEEISSDVESDDCKTSQRRIIEEIINSEEEFSPPKYKKLKMEDSEEKMNKKNKNKNKNKSQVKILNSDIDDSDSYNVERRNESVDEKSRNKKRRIKKEILSSETDSDINKTKKNKRTKIESNNIEKSSSIKKYKVKAEVLSSETDSGINEIQMKQNVKTKSELKDEKSRKKHKIKAELLTQETYD